MYKNMILDTNIRSVFIVLIYTTKIDGVVCPPNTCISETVAVKNRKTRTPSMYCLDNDQIHFKTNFTVHFKNYIKNNSANRRWRKPSPPGNHNLALRQLLEPSPIIVC